MPPFKAFIVSNSLIFGIQFILLSVHVLPICHNPAVHIVVSSLHAHYFVPTRAKLCRIL